MDDFIESSRLKKGGSVTPTSDVSVTDTTDTSAKVNENN